MRIPTRAHALLRGRGHLAFLALVSVVAVAAVAPSLAGAGVYYGFNYLSPSSPTGCLSAWGNGCAQNGFNYWKLSTMTKNSGDRIALGFRDTSGNFYYNTYGAGANGTTFSDTPGPGYNRAFCAYYSGNSSYVQCSSST